MAYSQTMLEPCVCGSMKYLRPNPQLLQVSQPLKLFGINYLSHILRKIDCSVDWIVDFFHLEIQEKLVIYQFIYLSISFANVSFLEYDITSNTLSKETRNSLFQDQL